MADAPRKPPRPTHPKDLPDLPPAPVPNPEEVRALVHSYYERGKALFWTVVHRAIKDCKCSAHFKARERDRKAQLSAVGEFKGAFETRVLIVTEYWTLIGPKFLAYWDEAVKQQVHGVPPGVQPIQTKPIGKRQAKTAVVEVLGEDAARDIVPVPNKEGGGIKITPAVPPVVPGKITVDPAATGVEDVDIRRDMKWVYQHIGEPVEKKLKAPSKGAAQWLQIARVNQKEFFVEFTKIFARQSEEESSRTLDDGREQIALLDQVRLAREKAMRDTALRTEMITSY